MKTKDIKQDNFSYMLVGLLVFLLISPSLSKQFPNHSLIGIQTIYLSLMFFSVWSLQKNKRWFSLGIGLIIMSIVLAIYDAYFHSAKNQLLNLFPLLLFCILSVIVAMKQVLFSGPITLNKLIGSICIYILLGIIWALFYLSVDLLTTNTFDGIPDEEFNQFWSYIYFSFVTLSTLGFGDIVPVNELARSLAYIEAISGQIYLTILVASLVGGYISEHSNGNPT
ncbi:hypothetical protein A9Q85_01490 [Cycloclasticus sp. 44_32_T64]|nr:hypothetical protein A9Q85_01490 [Cycloclasticus sp. 44_32_T64]